MVPYFDRLFNVVAAKISASLFLFPLLILVVVDERRLVPDVCVLKQGRRNIPVARSCLD